MIAIYGIDRPLPKVKRGIKMVTTLSSMKPDTAMDATSGNNGPRVNGDAYFRNYEHTSVDANSVLARRFPRFVKTDAPA